MNTQHRINYFLMILLLALIGCATGGGSTQSTSALPKQLRQGQIIVTLADATPEQWATTAKALSEEYQLREVGNFPLNSLRVQCIVYEIPGDRPLASVLDRLRRDPRVESVQINSVFAGMQASHSDQYAALEYGAIAMRADQAHRLSTGKGVRIMVIDTGMDKEHPDLRGRVTKIANFVEGGETSFAQDAHGTGVAGVIGARANDGVGIYGIAPEAELMAAKACWYPKSRDNAALCSSWTLAKALDFAINMNSQIINMSLSGPADALLERLIQAAQGKGIIVVAAAAQDADAPGFPADMASIIAVIASDSKTHARVPTWLSSRGFLAAPGIEILTTAPRESYDFLSGSSLAAAHVSGAIALLLEKRPDLSQSDIWMLLTSTAKQIPATAGKAGVGVADVCAALAKLIEQSGCF
jgi:subtilisin family serine protease